MDGQLEELLLRSTPNVGRIAAAVLHFLQVSLRPFQVHLPFADQDLLQCGMDISRHVLGISAHVKMAAIFESLPQLLPILLFAHQMVHVDLLGLVARKGNIEIGQHAVFSVFSQLLFVQEVLVGVSAAVVEDHRPDGLALALHEGALLDESSERRETTARANHDDRRDGLEGQPELTPAHVDGNQRRPLLLRFRLLLDTWKTMADSFRDELLSYRLQSTLG